MPRNLKDGVTVLVTGCLIGKDNLRRKFAQSFFLAPPDNGYFVLNDVVRYVEETEPLEIHSVNGVNKVPKTSETEHVNVTNAPPDQINSNVVEGQNVVKNADKLSDHERQLTNENESIVKSHSHPIGMEVSETPELSSSSLEMLQRNLMHQLRVKVKKGRSGPTRVYVPTNTVKVAPKKTENLSVESVNNVMPETSLVNVEMPKRNNNHEEVGSNNIGRGRIFSGSGGYRTDNFRPRRAGNYGGGAIRGYIRQEYGHSG